MTVGGVFVMYVKPVKEVALKILNNGRVYITRFSRGPQRPRYNGDAVYLTCLT